MDRGAETCVDASLCTVHSSLINQDPRGWIGQQWGRSNFYIEISFLCIILDKIKMLRHQLWNNTRDCNKTKIIEKSFSSDFLNMEPNMTQIIVQLAYVKTKKTKKDFILKKTQVIY